MIETMDSSLPENTLALNGLPTPAVKNELERILRSRVFIHSHRIRRFLQFVVDECLRGQQHRLKEYMIGLEVFNRVEAFDPRVDSIVRVEARRLRRKLDEYYQTEGRDDEVRIELRKGSYVPLFEHRRPGVDGFGHGPGPARRNSIAIGRFDGPDGTLKTDLLRQLTHILINEGFCQIKTSHPEDEEVSAEHNGHANGNGNGHGNGNGAGVDYVLDGQIAQEANGTRLLLQLLSVADGAYIWSESGDVDNLPSVARSLNRALLTFGSKTATARLQRHRGRSAGKELYIQGRYNWKLGTPETVRSSANMFAKAVERDATFAAAWGALSESLIVNGLFGFQNPRECGQRAMEAATRAVELNDSLPEAHIALGSALSLFEWEWEKGERELQRAIQLDPRDPSAHVAYALQLACRGMLSAAMAETERALDLDPASLATIFVSGWLRGVSKGYDDAIAEHSTVAQLAPDFALSYLGLGWANAAKGAFPDALAYFTNANNLLKCRTLLAGCMGYCYARLGNRDDAMRLLANLNSQPPTQFVSPVSMAAIHSGLGEMNRAFSCLDQAVEMRDSSLPLQLLNPEFEPLRNDGRFGALLGKIGLARG